MNSRNIDLKILTVNEAGTTDNAVKELIKGQTIGGQLTDEMIRFRDIGMQKIEVDHYRGRIDEPTKAGYRPKFTLITELTGFAGENIEPTPFNTDTGEVQVRKEKSIVILALLKDVSVLFQGTGFGEEYKAEILQAFDFLYGLYKTKLKENDNGG
mgnify:FL=1